MTKPDFFCLRQKEHWRNKHALTVTGYYVAGMGIGVYQKPRNYGKRYRSGRIVENPQGEWLEPAITKAWDMNGVALGHEFGNLDMATINSDI